MSWAYGPAGLGTVTKTSGLNAKLKGKSALIGGQAVSGGLHGRRSCENIEY
jgi:hypothetical protein